MPEQRWPRKFALTYLSTPPSPSSRFSRAPSSRSHEDYDVHDRWWHGSTTPRIPPLILKDREKAKKKSSQCIGGHQKHSFGTRHVLCPFSVPRPAQILTHSNLSAKVILVRRKCHLPTTWSWVVILLDSNAKKPFQRDMATFKCRLMYYVVEISVNIL